jgi:predicted Holliday junction resolvase-like endonuclease
MNPIWWFLIVIAALILLIQIASDVEAYARQSRAQEQAAMKRRLGKFEAEQRVRQQAAVMRRTREINALAHETCQAMLRAALEAQREELDSSLE